MPQRDIKSRLRWIALNNALFLGVGWLAFRGGGWQAAWLFVVAAITGTCVVLLRKPSLLHP